ncbi:hypothetical protein PVAP13_1KG456500 [Panicum virgatum]|uniref:GPI transamidase subunit PIG-U n=1 Tax=Panicum virgatum TaxID=38727 RepID=A0A8T0XR51_PANVG|nr:hypothetical protein PVAP13_1KG456500 [Panicum virgatum]
MAIRHYWPMVAAAVGFRLVLVLFGGDLHLAPRPEVSTPLTSLRRLAEGYWLKQASMSPYSGSMYHGSPLLLSVLGPLTSNRLFFLLGYGPDAPPTKVFLVKSSSDSKSDMSEYDKRTSLKVQRFSWMTVLHFIFWLFIWSSYVLLLSSMILKKVGGLNEMFEKTYGFVLTVKDLSPNIVFHFFRSFFLIVFNMNIPFMVLLLAIRLKHPPCFLAYVYTAIVAMLKSYPSVFWTLFANELAEMQFTFFLFFGYIGVSLLSPVMHNLWIWRGTGNANFYFATGLAYTCLQTVLVVECVGSTIKHDRKLRLLVTS